MACLKNIGRKSQKTGSSSSANSEAGPKIRRHNTTLEHPPVAHPPCQISSVCNRMQTYVDQHPDKHPLVSRYYVAEYNKCMCWVSFSLLHCSPDDSCMASLIATLCSWHASQRGLTSCSQIKCLKVKYKYLCLDAAFSLIFLSFSSSNQPYNVALLYCRRQASIVVVFN